jgi:tRNA dimethylallyltransferase
MTSITDPEFQVYFIVGTTASGKSSWALKWAEENDAVILNADSVQVFKHVNIGTAKPTSEDMSVCPHYLYDFVDSSIPYTAGEYRRDALETLEVLYKEKKYKKIFIVGGSGFYLKALEHGMYDIGNIPEDIKLQVDNWDLEGKNLFEMLIQKDPEYAKKISPNDLYRVRRGLEMNMGFGKTVLELQSEFEAKKQIFPYSLIKIGLYLDREKLRKKVQLRSDKMIESGLIDEVETLLKKGLKDWAPLKSVGYKEVVSYLTGEYSKEQMLERLVINTMQLAKRQRTWFKKQNDICWFDTESEIEKLNGVIS